MKMVTVLWADACQVGGTTWVEGARHERYPVLSVGLIVEETDETLHLARDTDGDSAFQWRAVIAIPKVLIVRRRDYDVAKAYAPQCNTDSP